MDTLALMSLLLEQLPKAYADQNEFRRANARFSVAGTETASMKTVEGNTIQVRKLRDKIVDEKISKEILPE